MGPPDGQRGWMGVYDPAYVQLRVISSPGSISRKALIPAARPLEDKRRNELRVESATLYPVSTRKEKGKEGYTLGPARVVQSRDERKQDLLRPRPLLVQEVVGHDDPADRAGLLGRGTAAEREHPVRVQELVYGAAQEGFHPGRRECAPGAGVRDDGRVVDHEGLEAGHAPGRHEALAPFLRHVDQSVGGLEVEILHRLRAWEVGVIHLLYDAGDGGCDVRPGDDADPAVAKVVAREDAESGSVGVDRLHRTG